MRWFRFGGLFRFKGRAPGGKLTAISITGAVILCLVVQKCSGGMG